MKTSLPSVIKESTKGIERSIISQALHQGYSVAMWRLPNQSKINLLLSLNSKLVDELAIEECSPGFVYAPFDPTQPKHFFEASHLFEISDEDISEITPGRFLESLDKGNTCPIKFHIAKTGDEPTSNEGFIDLVKQCINAIEAGSFEKVVPSAQQKIGLTEQFDLLNAFDELCKKYPSGMVSLVSDLKTGTWMGASPELLVSTDRNGIFRTVALAGTQVQKEDVSLKNISWTQKEIEEQALVERYIISCFKKIRVREYDEHGPKTVQAGTLFHLRSDFEVDMKAVNFPLLGSVMLKLLHPTSAVCGMPLDASIKFLQENEPYDREFYSGFLGPVNIESETQIFVNLRCLKWCDDCLYLYAGAGVTIDSEPEMEWMEVKIKMETIMKALGI